jgi:5-methyltetrahydropteroyltriglutamate--homocysteine methyltransferase
VVTELRAAGATWIQFDEPTLVKDLDAHQLQAFNYAYSELESTLLMSLLKHTKHSPL